MASVLPFLATCQKKRALDLSGTADDEETQTERGCADVTAAIY